jgi:hypothetical protein
MKHLRKFNEDKDFKMGFEEKVSLIKEIMLDLTDDLSNFEYSDRKLHSQLFLEFKSNIIDLPYDIMDKLGWFESSNYNEFYNKFYNDLKLISKNLEIYNNIENFLQQVSNFIKNLEETIIPRLNELNLIESYSIKMDDDIKFYKNLNITLCFNIKRK